MGRSNLIPITRIYDIYPKYTYSDDVKKFMDEIVDIDRANVCTKDEVIAMLTELQLKIKEHCDDQYAENEYPSEGIIFDIIQQKINALKENNNESY